MTYNHTLMTPSGVEDIIMKVVGQFDSIVLVYLFGSFAAKRPQSPSDVGVGIYFKKLTFDEFMKVHGP